MSDEYTDLPYGNTQVNQLDVVEATNACGVTLNRKNTMMKVYQRLQSDKRRIINGRGNWSTKEMERRDCSRRLWLEHISNLRKEHSASWRTRCQTIITVYYRNHDPEWFDHLRVIDQNDVLHITAEIRLGILRRWEKGHSHKYRGLVCWVDSVVRWDVAEKVERSWEWTI